MRKINLLFVAFVTMLMALPQVALADRTVAQLQFGKQTIEVGPDETITFLDWKENGGISSSSDNNAQSLTVFKPAPGMAIAMTFEFLEAQNDGSSWPSYVNIYAGDPDEAGSFEYATSTSQVKGTSTLPDGNIMERLEGSYTDKAYTSTDANGILSVGYIFRWAKASKGWKATVRCISVESMTVTGAAAVYDNVIAEPTTTSNVNFAAVKVTASGILNAVALTTVNFTLPVNQSAIEPTALRLYAGHSADFKNDTPLDATVAATSGGYAFTLNQPLADGDNYFTIVGDFLGTASPGSQAQVQITGVATSAQPDGVTPFEPATATQVSKPAIVLISTTPQVITVGDVPYNFYDDGGPDGNITRNFEGQVTFVPATTGMSIKIDFSKLDLFNTSTVVGYNDVFNFYNGHEANADNLITTLLNEAEIVKSTADDGSLTVTFKSTAGTTKSGWEALVSQFLPGDMTIAEVTASTVEGNHAAAGDRDVQMLLLDVVADNTANPLSLTAINLSTPDAKNMACVRAYYLGKKNTFSNTDVFGEATVTGTDITITGSHTLAEGHNYVAIVLDLNDEGVNDEVVTLSLTQAVVGTENHQAQATATRSISNICRATLGTHSHVIKDSWAFTNEEGGSGKYDTTTGDHIVTFTPADANAVVQMTFSNFDVTYSSSSYYGVKALFEVYSGSTISEDNLLWRLSDADHAKTGPGHVLRSAAADGSLTVRFDPKENSSYYAATGWQAEVTPFVNHEMLVNDVTVAQTSTDVIPAGSKDAEIIDFNIVTEGNLTSKVLTGVQLTLKGAEALDKVTVLCHGTQANASDAVVFGSIEEFAADGVVTVTGEKTLAEGDNQFSVIFDVKADVEAETAVDAALTKLQFEDDSFAVEQGNPDGERVVKYIYIMQAGDQVITVNKPLLFYDDGGPDGNFSRSFTGATTFVPGIEGYGIEMNAVQFGAGSSTLYLYNGREHNGATDQIGSYSGTNGPQGVISDAEDGTMTAYFSTTSYTTQTSGWVIEVKLHEYAPNELSQIDTEPATDEDVVRGSTDAELIRMTLTVTGDNGPVNINDFVFNTEGEGTAAKLYYTADVPSFNTSNLVAQSQTFGGALTLSAEEPITITRRGTYYAWLAVDVNPDAEPGSTVKAEFVSAQGTASDAVINSQEVTRSITAGFQGTYTIGASEQADFATFAQAIEAMSVGLEGPVRFEVEDGTYAENVEVSSVAGTSEQHSITFAAKSGNSDAVVITGGTPATGYGVVSQVILVDNTPYVTFDAITVAPANQGFSNAIRVIDRSHNFKLTNSTVKAEQTTATTGMNLVYITTTDENGSACNNVVVENNNLQGGGIGINFGYSNVAHAKALKPVVKGNNISETGRQAIYLNMTTDALVADNTVYQSTTTSTAYAGIDMFYNDGQFILSGNKIVNAQSSYSSGIYLRNNNIGNDARVFNNSIVITGSNSSNYGIRLHGGSKNVDFAYNTVRMIGQGRAMHVQNAAATGIKLRNNLMQGLAESGELMFVYSNKYEGLEMSNNALYHANGNITPAIASIDELNTTVGNTTNIWEQASFLADTDNHLTAQGGLNMALPIDYVTVDADGYNRNETTPTVGAYEFREVSVEKPELAEGYPVVITPVAETQIQVKTKWNVGGKLFAIIETVEQGAQPAGAPAKRAKAPTADELLATTPADVMPDTETTTTFDELEPDTDYRAYFLMESALGEKSDVVTTDVIRTARHISPLTITLANPCTTIEAGQSTTITPQVEGGDEPYTYEWRDQMNNVLGTEATIEVTPEYTYGYTLTVNSADGQKAVARTGVYVLDEATPATFDDNYVAENSDNRTGEDSGVFYSGSYAFNMGAILDWSYFYGYWISNQQDNSFTNYVFDDSHSAPGGAHSSSNFAVGFPEGLTIDVTNDPEGDVISGFYVTNSAYALNTLLHDNSNVGPLADGGYFKLSAVGTAADGTTTTTDFYLADYRAEKAIDHYAIDTWQWFDLRPLGKVKKISFTFDGTQANNYGLWTPKYLCMDDFNGQPDVAETSKNITLGENDLDLTQLFELDNDGSTVTYRIEPEDAERVTFALGESDQLTVTCEEAGDEGTVLITATQKGKTQFLRLHVIADMPTAVSSLNSEAHLVDVTYVNVAGITSDKPFEGVNMVIKRYDNGSVVTGKILK